MVFLTTTWQMMVAGCLSQMADCVLPAVKAIVSKKVDETNVGRVLSRLTAAEALACMIAFLVSAVLTALVLMGGTVWMATHRKVLQEPENPAQHLVVKYKAVNKAARVECGV
nr:hypothetical protein BaRGS_023255 [Batillaria attramentaria]